MERMMLFALTGPLIPPPYLRYGVAPPTRAWFTGPTTTYLLHLHELVLALRSTRLDTTDVVGCAQVSYPHPTTCI